MANNIESATEFFDFLKVLDAIVGKVPELRPLSRITLKLCVFRMNFAAILSVKRMNFAAILVQLWE